MRFFLHVLEFVFSGCQAKFSGEYRAYNNRTEKQVGEPQKPYGEECYGVFERNNEGAIRI